MTTDSHKALPADATVAVIGAGTMGSGIALVAATAGHPVLLHDANAAAIDRGLGQLRAGLDRLVERGRIEPQEREARLARITPAPALDMLAPAALVIEAIVEDLDVKASLLGKVEALLGPDAIVATNTSSLSVTALAARLQRPERVVGMHFFNPAPQLPLVEVVSGHLTSAGDGRDDRRHRPSLGQGPRPLPLDAGLHRQPRGAAILRRGSSPSRGGCRDAGHHRRRLVRGRRVPDGPVRAHGPDRARRELRRHPLGLRGPVPRPALPALAPAEGPGRCRPARPQERARVLRLSGRGGAARACRGTTRPAARAGHGRRRARAGGRPDRACPLGRDHGPHDRRRGRHPSGRHAAGADRRPHRHRAGHAMARATSSCSTWRSIMPAPHGWRSLPRIRPIRPPSSMPPASSRPWASRSRWSTTRRASS